MRSDLIVLALAAGCGGPSQSTPPPPASRVLPIETGAAQVEPEPPPPDEPEESEPSEPTRQTKLTEPTKPPDESAPVDGVYSPRAVRASGSVLLDQRITVKGTVVWIYDCVADLAEREPDKSRDEIRKRIAKRPELCKRPHLYLGDSKGAPVARSIQVVELPRPIRPDERISLTDAEVAAWPKVPSISVGQVVTVEGTWALHSPKGYANPDGLLVYGRLIR